MTASEASSQAIATLITHLRQVGLDLNALEMADVLWLLLEKSKYTASGDESEEVQEENREDDRQELPGRESGVSSAASAQPAASVVLEPPSEADETDSAAQAQAGTALPIAIPAASALPQAMQIARSLRPLMRKVKSRSRRMLDEEATVVRIVDERIWSPVMEPAPERWLELAIVVEETSLLEVWQETIAEFQQLMERHGAFRDVRSWQLVCDRDGSARLFRRKLSGIDRSQPRQPGELLDPSGRRLIWLVSDCTSAGWRSGRVLELLGQWMEQNPVTLVQLLPGRLWERSTLGWGDAVWLGATEPGVLNDRLMVEGLPRKRHLETHEEGSGEGQRSALLTLPVVTLDPLSLKQWARMMVGSGEPLTSGVVFDLDELAGYVENNPESPLQDTENLSPEELVQRFRGTASPTARRLAEMMAAVPVSGSVIRLIQRNLLPQSDTVHVAEVFLSGLLRPVRSPIPEATPGTRIRQRYEFVSPRVRQLLLSAVPVYATEGVLEKVAEDALSQLPIEVRRQLSEDIAQRLGRSPRSFEAFLVPELLQNLSLEEEMRSELLPFAEITAEVLQQLGAEYAAIAQQLHQVPVQDAAPVVQTEWVESANWEIPLLETFEFEVGEFVETAEEQPRSLLRVPHEFTVATIEVQTAPKNLQSSRKARSQSSSKRRRGVVLTAQGLQKLREAIDTVEQEEMQRLTIERLGARTGLSYGSVSKVLACKHRVEQHTLDRFFQSFNLTLAETDYCEPEAGQATQIIIRRTSKQDWQYIETLTEDLTLELVKIPGGSFLMGSSEEELESRDSERPQHEVTLSEFYMGKFPVTQAQWQFVAGLPQVERELDPDPARFKGSDRPIECVSWFDAVEFCDRLSQLTGRTYRLPSEAEWEYACRAGTTTPFHFGETIDSEIANYCAQDEKIGDTTYPGKYGRGRLGEYRKQTTPVGSFQVANEWGLYEMHGNVWEWCGDRWHSNYEGAPTDGSAWIDEIESESDYRVLRGGSWIVNPRNCRSASRYFYVAGFRVNFNFGFRVVCLSSRTRIP
ncbi:MAG: formylglycine-generating enzyme family protein [Oculatellaceae cyanobacterium Prado106]|nr:formylglycine-generating enzyme family protein [Oculatellaceae cyanobacterium Prado106]